METQSVRGTHDVVGNDAIVFDYIIDEARLLATENNFITAHTPVIEYADLYTRNLGEETDIVSKEIYIFEDRNLAKLALRPEFTAGIARMFVSRGMYMQQLPQKIFSFGPLFRYDRPQKGRYRQFNQVNFEVIGCHSFKTDITILHIANELLTRVGLISGIDYELKINFLGCKLVKHKFEESLKDYFMSQKNLLSEDSIKRLQTNPLRILDSKEKCDAKVIANAPLISSHYSNKEHKELEKITKALTTLGISYVLDNHLVRGIDYYDGLVFEFVSKQDAAQSTILGGGRYSSLIKEVSGKIDISAIGFAAGVERISLIEKVQAKAMKRPRILVGIIPECDELFDEAMKLLKLFSHESSIKYEISYLDASLSKKIKKMSSIGCNFIVVFGKYELESGLIKVKNLKTKSEEEIKIDREEISRLVHQWTTTCTDVNKENSENPITPLRFSKKET